MTEQRFQVTKGGMEIEEEDRWKKFEFSFKSKIVRVDAESLLRSVHLIRKWI